MEAESLKIPNCFYRISVKALILDADKRFLLSLENNGLSELPGVGLSFGENPLECLSREIHEEMGLEIDSIKKQPVYFLTVLHQRSQHWICNIIYEVMVKDLIFTPSEECIEIRFFTKQEAMKENLYNNVGEFVRVYNPDLHVLNI